MEPEVIAHHLDVMGWDLSPLQRRGDNGFFNEHRDTAIMTVFDVGKVAVGGCSDDNGVGPVH